MEQPPPASTGISVHADGDVSQNGPVTAVFLLNIDRYTAPLLAGWVQSGNRIGAIVVPGFRRRPKGFSVGNIRRRLQRRLLLKRYLGNIPTRLIEFGKPYDWDVLRRQLSGIEADVLISYAFPRLVPQDALAGFRMGGLNLHPALLPNYRGPHPLHRLVVDGQHAVYGGVTLHRMSVGYDEGDILAQVAFSEADWASKQSLAHSTATAFRMLVSGAVPAYCRGTLSGMPQPEGDFIWAELEPAHMMVLSSMPMEHVARLWRVLGTVPGIYLRMADCNVRLGVQIRRLGPPTGRAPIKRWASVEFDLADGRVVHLTYNRLLKRLIKVHDRLASAKIGEPHLEMRLFGQSE
ncbi:formyltransferase family protein [Mesorhizobium loti]|uniref:formyltransferase family protein n=1 Tax=Rhizobium loti TaxID=381 RepID=UPI0009E2A927|nr:formyltransferase family protein [Mesorhizobium loti]